MALGMGEKRRDYEEYTKKYTQEELESFRKEREEKEEEKKRTKIEFESNFSKAELEIISENRNDIYSFREIMAEQDVYFDSFVECCKEYLKDSKIEEEIEEEEESEMEITFKNYTPHSIVVQGLGTFESSGIARVETTQKVVGNLAGIYLVQTEFGQVVGLPEMEKGTYIIVSAMVLSALNGSRADVIAPDTGNTAIRNEKGQIIAVTRFTK